MFKKTTVCKFFHSAFASFSSGNCVLIEKKPEKLLEDCLILPRTPENSDIMYFLRSGSESLSNFFFTRRSVVLNTLTYLKQHHKDYHDIIIRENEARDITSSDSSLFIRNNFSDNLSFSSQNNSNNNYFNVSAVSRIDAPSHFNQITPLPQEITPFVCDYETSDGWLSTCFFHLFSNGNGDVTRRGRLYTVTLK